MKARRRWARIFSAGSILAGVAVMALVARRIAGDAEGVELGLPPASHALALAAVAVEILARGVRVCLLARGLGARLSLPVSVLAQLAADGAASVTPSRSGSDPAKAAVLRKELGWGVLGAALLGEIVIEACLLLPVSLALAALVPEVPVAGWGGVGYAAAVVALGAIAVVIARRASRGERPVPTPLRWVGIQPARWKAMARTAGDFVEEATELRRLSPAIVAGLVVTTLLHMAARLAILPAVVLPAAEVPVAVGPLVAWPFLFLWGGALLPPPGGGGLVEAGFAFVLREALGPSLLPAALVWWRIYSFYFTALVGGGVLLFLRPKKQADRTEGPEPSGEGPGDAPRRRAAEAGVEPAGTGSVSTTPLSVSGAD